MATKKTSLKSYLNRELKKRKINPAEINLKKNREIKKELLPEITRLAIIDSQQAGGKKGARVGDVLKRIRASGLKTSNQAVRDIFYERTQKEFKSTYATRLKPQYKPKPERLPYLKVREVKGGYLYTYRVYLRADSRKENIYTLPRRGHGKKRKGFIRTDLIKVGKGNKFARTAKQAFWSDTVLSKETVERVIRAKVTGTSPALVQQYVVSSSNVDNINFSQYSIIAFTYTGVLRS